MTQRRRREHSLPFQKPMSVTTPAVHHLEESSLYRHPMSDAKWAATLKKVSSNLEGMDSDRVRCHVNAILKSIEFVDGFMERYCSLTCAACEDPCCHGKKIFFNQADIIFLVSSGLPAPPGQTRSQSDGMCRYLSANGCELSRKTRPYVCVWFLCETHMSHFLEEEIPVQKAMLKAFEQIRAHRLSLEAEYQTHPG